jgi:hypothetical protein
MKTPKVSTLWFQNIKIGSSKIEIKTYVQDFLKIRT